MTAQDKLTAIQIITLSSQAKVSFNVPVDNSYCNVYDIVLHTTNASLINKLVEAGFSLFMIDKGLVVEKYR